MYVFISFGDQILDSEEATTALRSVTFSYTFS